MRRRVAGTPPRRASSPAKHRSVVLQAAGSTLRSAWIVADAWPAGNAVAVRVQQREHGGRSWWSVVGVVGLARDAQLPVTAHALLLCPSVPGTRELAGALAAPHAIGHTAYSRPSGNGWAPRGAQ